MSNSLNVIARLVTNDDEMRHDQIHWHKMRYEHTMAIRSILAEKYAFSTVNKMLAALRGTLKSAWKLGLMSADEYQTAASFRNVVGDRLPAGRYIDQGEISQLLATCQDTIIGQRDRTIILLLYLCGLRRDEIVKLKVEDYLRHEAMLQITGKRNKQRRVPVPKVLIDYLDQWLEMQGKITGPFFAGVGNRNQGKHLSGQMIYEMLKGRAQDAGLPSLSPHDFRRTYISNLLDNGVDIVTVQKLAGHANVETTANYDRRGEKAKRLAVDSLSVPNW